MNTKSVAVIPTLERPEFLALCLEKISNAENAPDDIRIFLDTCTDERLAEIDKVRDEYCPAAEIYRAGKHVTAPSGTWNILNALREGYETGADFIFMIEEDVMIRPEFFNRHYEMQSKDDYFVTCARQASNRRLGVYSNPGSCYRRDKLAMVMPHVNAAYFRDPAHYVTKMFSGWPEAGSLDDGLVQRVIYARHGKVGCADPAIAAHQGFRLYGMTEEYRTFGSVEDRVEQLRAMLDRIDPGDRYTRDFEKF